MVVLKLLTEINPRASDGISVEVKREEGGRRESLPRK